nr:probable ADP-ribosylation factor GTPase-activating protein AGD8 [Arachis hypogaea]
MDATTALEFSHRSQAATDAPSLPPIVQLRVWPDGGTGFLDMLINVLLRFSQILNLMSQDQLVSSRNPCIIPLVPSWAKVRGGNRAGRGGYQASPCFYPQKSEEPPAPVPLATNNNVLAPSITSRFEYVENVQSSEVNSGGSQVIGYVAPPKSSSFLSDFGMDSGFSKKSGPSSSKVQVSYMIATFVHPV